jgi:poly(3-hydroxybutyrate) depolymerase
MSWLGAILARMDSAVLENPCARESGLVFKFHGCFVGHLT